MSLSSWEEGDSYPDTKQISLDLCFLFCFFFLWNVSLKIWLFLFLPRKTIEAKRYKAERCKTRAERSGKRQLYKNKRKKNLLSRVTLKKSTSCDHCWPRHCSRNMDIGWRSACRYVSKVLSDPHQDLDMLHAGTWAYIGAVVFLAARNMGEVF